MAPIAVLLFQGEVSRVPCQARGARVKKKDETSPRSRSARVEPPDTFNTAEISNLRKKIRDYNRSDLKRGRLKYCVSLQQQIDQELDLDQVVKLIQQDGMTCYLCQKPVVLDYNKRYQGNQFTLDRIDNKKSHRIDNCKICCFTCNILRMNECTPEEFSWRFKLPSSNPVLVRS